MCEGYWETCTCEDCKKVKELFSDLSFYWDNEEEREEIERTIESMGYSIQPLLSLMGGRMKELDFIKNERLKLQQEYLKQSKNIWTNFEGIEADKKHKKVYNEYRNKDYFLEGLQAKIEDILKDIDYYKGK